MIIKLQTTEHTRRGAGSQVLHDLNNTPATATATPEEVPPDLPDNEIRLASLQSYFLI